jgi:natural product precursor
MSKFNKLSRAEMRDVLGGSAPVPCTVKCYRSEALITTVQSSFCAANPVTQCPGMDDYMGTPPFDNATCSCYSS